MQSIKSQSQVNKCKVYGTVAPSRKIGGNVLRVL
jgi:hypothetical protein